jgi:hypothetical protein
MFCQTPTECHALTWSLLVLCTERGRLLLLLLLLLLVLLLFRATAASLASPALVTTAGGETQHKFPA